jgi:ribosomal-protein-alanine N-acetyltransferase
MTTGAPIKVDRAGAESLPAIEQVIAAAFDPRFGEAWTKAQCLSVLALPGYAITIASSPDIYDDASALSGFSIQRTVGIESELLLLGVDPVRRRKGIASALISDWLQRARIEGVERAFLEMRSDNPARTVYERFAFCDVAVRRAYYRGGDGILRDAVTMECRLDG